MMTRALCVLAVAGAIATSSTPAAAQPRGRGPGCGPGGWGREGAYWRLFDPSKVEALTGVVVSIRRVHPVRGVADGAHLQLRTAKETVDVHLGPAWYIDNQDPPIRVNDAVEIRGSRVRLNGKTAILASEVRKGDARLSLRDADGSPRWCGWRRRGADQP
jgi:hypothetical protein